MKTVAQKTRFDLFTTAQPAIFTTRVNWLQVIENNGGPCRIRICDLYRVKVVQALSLHHRFRKLLILQVTVCSVTVQFYRNRSLLFNGPSQFANSESGGVA